MQLHFKCIIPDQSLHLYTYNTTGYLTYRLSGVPVTEHCLGVMGVLGVPGVRGVLGVTDLGVDGRS